MEVLFCNGVKVSSDGIAVSKSSSQVSFDDRGLQYGDGVFETLRIFEGEIPMWKFHQDRLQNAQCVLKLPLEDFFCQWPEFVEQHLSHIENACAKLVITRGEGPRGYKIPVQPDINWWLKITDFPKPNQAQKKPPYRLTLCQHPISRQPKLAGLKHLNRLDQVMARSEWKEQDDFDEGIMFNLDGDVIEGTMSNIFWLKNDQLYTPDLSQEGIDGCVRRWLIKYSENSALPVIISAQAKLDLLNAADAVFLTNSLIGIQAVAEIDGQAITQNNQVDFLADAFNQQYLAAGK
jgi:4-amino-4-deoxychorismate lyase